MIDELKKSIQSVLNERISSPFSGTFFFAWFVWNWRMLYYLIFPDDTLTLEAKLYFVSSHFINWNHNLLFPFYSTIFLIVIYPFITTGSLWVWLRFKKWQTDLKNKIEGTQLLTLPQSIRIQEKIQEAEEKFAKMLLSKDEEVKSKKEEVDILTGELNKREVDAQTAFTNKEEELANKIIEFEKLEKELEYAKQQPGIILEGTARVENNAEEELLDSLLSDATLQEYTSNKFRGLAVSPELQKKILKDIQLSNYPTLRNIDNAVNRAIPALVAYQLESPHMFEWGTDYISKAIGFVDDNFRAVHGFGNETKSAFIKYGSLVKQPNEKIQAISEKIPINDLWRLNHWESNCASIVGEKMIFSGTSAPKGEDGSHIDLNNKLVIGNTYEISCFAKSERNTTGMFKLWCHDETGVSPHGVRVETPYKTPSTMGEIIKLIFKADFNKNIRIHLQYTPGQGRIEISDVRILELKI